MQKLGRMGMSFEAPKVPKMSFLQQSPTFSPHAVIDDQRSCTGFWLIGCISLRAEKDTRVYYRDHVPKEDQKGMTPSVCFEFCKGIDGTQYMAIENGRDCYCMPYYKKSANGAG